jgi:hypothetical protein
VESHLAGATSSSPNPVENEPLSLKDLVDIARRVNTVDQFIDELLARRESKHENVQGSS